MSRCLFPVMLSAALAGCTVGPDDRAAMPGTLKEPGQFRSAGAIDPEQAPQLRAHTAATIPMFETSRATAANRIAVLPGEAPGGVDARLAPERRIPLAPAARDRAAAVIQPRPDACAVREQLFLSPAGQAFRGPPGGPAPVALWFVQADADLNRATTRAELADAAVRIFTGLARGRTTLTLPALPATPQAGVLAACAGRRHR